MIEFEQFVARHGEILAQALLEDIERREGIHGQFFSSLEERWTAVMTYEAKHAKQSKAA
jgi:hypothetical protein